MRDYHFSMGKRYAELLEMIWFTFLYEDLIPVGIFLILIGLFLYYWIDKYTLLRRSTLVSHLANKLPIGCLDLLDLCIVWKYIGEIIFDSQIRDGVKPISLVMLALAIIYQFIPWGDVFDCVDHEEYNLNDQTYTEEKNRFRNHNYAAFNPFYHRLEKMNPDYVAMP